MTTIILKLKKKLAHYITNTFFASKMSYQYTPISKLNILCVQIIVWYVEYFLITNNLKYFKLFSINFF